MELSKDLQDSGNFAPDDRFLPPAGGAVQKRAQVAMPGVLDRQAVERPAVGSDDRKGVENPDGARVLVQQLAEVRFAQPAVDPPAGLDAHAFRNGVRPADAIGEKHLAESALADETAHTIAEARLRTGDNR